MDVAAWALVGYAVGALPFAYVLAVLSGRAELTERMSRTVSDQDAHVVLKAGGAGRAATAAATLDVLKGFVPALVAVRVSGPYPAAACGIGAVAGHCWPPAWRRFAGRGLSTAAGVFLALLPLEFVVGGAVTALGYFAKAAGLASTIGFAAVPVLAVLRHQPAPYVLAAVTVVLLIVVRRLEGVGEDVRRGVPPVRAVLRRALFDVSRAP